MPSIWFGGPALIVGALLLPGCAERYPLAPVSGLIRLDGQPLAGARIGFEPVRKGDSPNAGPGSYGLTDADGRYTLTTLAGRPGAVVGRHRVWVRTFQGKQGPAGTVQTVVPEKLPARYHDETELTFEVPAGGTEEANFDLTSR